MIGYVRDGWRPALALWFWYTVNICTVIFNRWVFHKMGFGFPFFLTTVHMLSCGVYSFIWLRVLKLTPESHVHADTKRRLPFLAMLFVINIVLGNISLKHVPVSFMQTIKASVPLFTVLGQFLFVGKRFSTPVVLSLIPICGGVLAAANYEVNYDLVGFLAALAASITTAAQTILSSLLLRGLDSFSLVFNVAPLATFFMVICVGLFEASDILAASDAITLGLVLALLVSGLVAFLLNVATFLAIQWTSALTFNVAGNFKVVLSVIISVLVFQNEVTIHSAMGCAAAIIGTAWYNYLRHQEAKKKSV